MTMTLKPDKARTHEHPVSGDLGIVYADHTVRIPVEVFENKMDLEQLINLGMNKRDEIEKLVRAKAEEAESRSLEERENALRQSSIHAVSQQQQYDAYKMQQEYEAQAFRQEYEASFEARPTGLLGKLFGD